jgi:hypothetical protein
MNKTQVELISRLVNRYNTGSLKQGWTLTNANSIFLSLQNLSEGNQAHKLAEKYPEVFASCQKAFRLVNLTLIDDLKARELLNKYQGVK